MDAKAILDFMEEVGKLKILPRTGWLLRGLKNPESIADHCFRTSVLAMLLADILVTEGIAIDTEKVIRLALLHDIAESQIGDIPYLAMRYIPEDLKEAGERQAVRSMVECFGVLGDQYTKLWEEYEQGTTLEGKLVRAVDKLEMMIQVYEYEKVGYKSLEGFWQNPANMKHFDGYPLLDEIMQLLQERHHSL